MTDQKDVSAQDAAAHSPDECGRECQYYDYFEMLWNWFADESRNGSEDMRANIPDGLSADDFKNMLDEHEAALMADIALKQPEPRTPAASEKPGFNAIKREQEICTLEAEVLRLREQLEQLQYGIAAVSFAMGWTDVCGKTNEEFARDLRRERDLAVSQVESARAQAIEECARIAEKQAQDFLSPEYAANQPLGSLCERFACAEVAKAIRDSNTSTNGQPEVKP